MDVDWFVAGLALGVAFCAGCSWLIGLTDAALDRQHRMHRARLNAKRLEQEKFFTQWHEGSR